VVRIEIKDPSDFWFSDEFIIDGNVGGTGMRKRLLMGRMIVVLRHLFKWRVTIQRRG
jgi:hypothetical protein